MSYPPVHVPVRNTQQWGFLLDRLCEHGDIIHAVAVAIDGLKIATSRSLGDDAADHLSAVTSGLSSLATSNANAMGVGVVTEILVGMEGGNLLVLRIDDTALLTVLATPTAHMGQVATAMGQFIQACGEAFVPVHRQS